MMNHSGFTRLQDNYMFEYWAVCIPAGIGRGNPWWFANEVAQVLGFGKTRISELMKRLYEDEKDYDLIVTLGGTQRCRIVNEPGLYSLILRSRKPSAKVFKRRIKRDVLPAIRKTGGYIMGEDEIMAQSVLMAGHDLPSSKICIEMVCRKGLVSGSV
jgi:prophage antirepressor-like protein